ncbi:MAG: glutamyl-tRNA reductase, partial [Eggerthellaceae bacterium]|nr:glutamyl-tRNA reductase [Eggerthellaceae bacterium]
MSLVVVGLNYNTASLSLREKAHVAPEEIPGILHEICKEKAITEAAVLSTCNRTEVYISAATDRYGVDAAVSFFVGRCGAEYEQDSFYVHRNEAAVQWLLTVASSLDSQVLGETQILSQVKQAYQAAVDAGTCKEMLTKLFKSALHTGKRVRSETQISCQSVSVSTVAADVAAKHVGQKDANVLIVGSGEMARLAALALCDKGQYHLTVCGRTIAHARVLADECGG